MKALRTHALVLIVSVAALFVGAPAQAELIPGFALQPSPDIGSGFISTNYNSLTNSFSANGFALTLDGANFDVSGLFSIAATIDENGDASAGSLLIDGEVNGNGVGANMLLEADLVDFGFPINPADFSPGPFQFIFQVTGGDLAADFGGVGALVGVRLTQNLGFDGDFDDDFMGGGLLQPSIATTAPLVPAPSAFAALIAAGLIGGRRRRRRG